jgi:hypothetical protein
MSVVSDQPHDAVEVVAAIVVFDDLAWSMVMGA